jgi:hypothetical protein
MKKLVLIPVLVATLSAVLILPAFSEEDSLEAKVTPLVLAVSLSEDLINYGPMPLSTDNDTRTQKASASINVANTGSVPAEFVIEGTDATSAVAGNSPWTLNCSPSGLGTVGANQFAHRFVVGLGDWASQGQALCSGANSKLLWADMPVGGMIDFKLQMNMPTSSTGYGERTTQVIVTAMQP